MCSPIGTAWNNFNEKAVAAILQPYLRDFQGACGM
jgi:hypothetical protein